MTNSSNLTISAIRQEIEGRIDALSEFTDSGLTHKQTTRIQELESLLDWIKSEEEDDE